MLQDKKNTSIPEILVCSDNKLLVDIICYKAKAIACNIEQATDIHSIMKLAVKKKYDVIVIDIMLSFIDGIEILEYIKSKRKNYNKPILVISSKIIESDLLKVLNANVDKYMVKPIDPDELNRTMQDLLVNSGFYLCLKN